MLGITQIDFIGHIKALAADGAQAVIDHLNKLVNQHLADPVAQAIIRPRLESFKDKRMLLVKKIQQRLDARPGVQKSDWTVEMLLEVLRYWVGEARDPDTEAINPYDDTADLLKSLGEIDECTRPLAACNEASDSEGDGQAESPGAVETLPNVIAQETAEGLYFLIKPPTPEAFLATLKNKGNYQWLKGSTIDFTALTDWMKMAFIDAYLKDLKSCAERTVRHTILCTAEAAKKELEEFMDDHNAQLEKQIEKPKSPSEELLNCLCAYGNLTAFWGANERLREHSDKPKPLANIPASAFEIPLQSSTAI